MRANLFVYRDMQDPLAAADEDSAGREALAGADARPAQTDSARSRCSRREDQAGRSRGQHQLSPGRDRAAPATRSRPRARRPAPAATRCSPTSERLCNHHIPRWLASDGMGADKIAVFYDDPVKVACEAFSRDKGVLPARALDRDWRALASAADHALRRRECRAAQAASALGAASRRVRARQLARGAVTNERIV